MRYGAPVGPLVLAVDGHAHRRGDPGSADQRGQDDPGDPGATQREPAGHEQRGRYPEDDPVARQQVVDAHRQQ